MSPSPSALLGCSQGLLGAFSKPPKSWATNKMTHWVPFIEKAWGLGVGLYRKFSQKERECRSGCLLFEQCHLVSSPRLRNNVCCCCFLFQQKPQASPDGAYPRCTSPRRIVDYGLCFVPNPPGQGMRLFSLNSSAPL